MTAITKPAKPTADFPLFAHSSKQWAKKVKGQTKYFGHWDDPQGALTRYLGTIVEGMKSENVPVQHVPILSKTPKVAKATLDKKKPHKDFPLFRHNNGQWAKQVKGKVWYFGTDADEALTLWLQQKDELLAGRKPLPQGLVLATLEELVNRYLVWKGELVTSGELVQRTYDQYEADGKMLLEFFGRDAIVDRISPADLEKYRAHLATTHSARSLSNAINRTRMIFSYGKEQHIHKEIDYGKGFERPRSKVLRKEEKQKGDLSFTAEQIKALLKIADRQLEAMILLGINCGFGNSDCATLKLAQLDLEKGYHNYWRPKTEVERGSPLWPETIGAIKRALMYRNKPKLAEHTDLVFVTRCGNSWSKYPTAIGLEFRKLLDTLKIHTDGLGFYSLRRTFETVGELTRDQAAVSFIMGHVPKRDDMASVYRQAWHERLQSVTDFMRQWLYGKGFVKKSA